MVAPRTRILVGATLLLGVLAATAAIPVAAADCALAAPAYVNVGTPLAIEGSGFPASASVDIEIAIDGDASDSFSVQSDAAGALQIALVPEDVDIGVTTVQATAGSACTAEVTYSVLAAGATPPPAATPEPEPESGGAGVVAPRTDVPAPGSDKGSTVPSWPWLALSLVIVGLAGLALSRLGRRA